MKSVVKTTFSQLEVSQILANELLRRTGIPFQGEAKVTYKARISAPTPLETGWKLEEISIMAEFEPETQFGRSASR